MLSFLARIWGTGLTAVLLAALNPIQHHFSVHQHPVLAAIVGLVCAAIGHNLATSDARSKPIGHFAFFSAVTIAAPWLPHVFVGTAIFSILVVFGAFLLHIEHFVAKQQKERANG